MNSPPTILEEMTDPEAIARAQAQHQCGRRNLSWLQAHWNNVLPHALGKYMAVAGEEAFLAETALEALELARAAHPEDDGVFVEYVLPPEGPRL